MAIEILDTFISQHTCTKIWTNPFYYLFVCLKTARWEANSVDHDQSQYLRKYDNALYAVREMDGGGWERQRCCVSCVSGVSNWYWLTVGQGLLPLQQVGVEGECFYYVPHHIVFSADPAGVGISAASCLHSISLMNGWILAKLTQIYHLVGEKCWLGFDDLGLIFKVT